MPDRLPPPDTCANCGAGIPRSARACPDCGADERTGWREESIYDGLDLPDEAFTAGGDENPDRNPVRPAAVRINGVPWYWWAAGVVLLGCLILAFLRL